MQARLLVVTLEVGARHVDLAAHFQHVRPALALQLLRDHLDLAQVGADVLAGGTVATGRALHEHAVLVAQVDRQAVELGLGGEHQRRPAQALVDAAHEVTHFLVAEGIAQRQHRHRMHDLGEPRGRLAAHRMGHRVGRIQLRMRRLQRLQLTDEVVVLGVGNDLFVALVIGA